LNIIPHALDFEKAVIASVLQDPLLLPKIQNLVEPDDFYGANHKEIWKVINSFELGQVDSLAVADKLRTDVQPYFKEIVEDSDRILPSISNALFYAEVIHQKSKLRAGIELGQNIIAACYQETDAEEAIQQLEEMFAHFLQKRVLENKSESTQESFKQFLKTLGTREPDDPNAIRTGFRELDLLLQRLEGLIVLAARPSMGKTALALNIIANVAEKHPVLFFSLEQSETQVFERLLASEAELPLEDIRLGVYDTELLESAEKRLVYLMENIHVDQNANVSVSYVTSVSRQKKYEWGKIGLIVIDYLHIMKLGANKNTTDLLEDAVRELRALGKELDCPILLLAQLSRGVESNERKKNRRPELSDLRGSGGIEQSADSVVFLYRESYYDQAGLAPDVDYTEVIVRKNRNGRQGNINLKWYPKIVAFKDER
jgi:replicative DNA helicase